MENKVIDQIRNRIVKGNVSVDEPMRDHTTFRTGGPAKVFAEPADADELKAILDICRKSAIPFYFLGNGSNLLVSDQGFDGVIILIGQFFGKISVEGNTIYAEAGALLSKTALVAGENALTGLEFASGIPGTVGGAVIMNAGAYGGEMKQVVSKVKLLTKEGVIEEISGESMEFGYRTSLAAKRGDVVLGAELKLEQGEKKAIKERMAELNQARRTKQPLEYPSAGSTFKRPEGYFAGKLIQDAGLAGYRFGGACVSEKHCGFVVNDQNGTSADIMRVITHVRETVKERFGVDLEMEVRRLGNFEEE